MKISNFKLIVENPSTIHATIDIESGVLWWKKLKTVQIFLNRNTIYWRFLDTGDWAPQLEVKKAYSSYLAKKDLASYDRH